MSYKRYSPTFLNFGKGPQAAMKEDCEGVWVPLEAAQQLEGAIRAVLSGDYRDVMKYQMCPHGLYGFEPCKQCLDEFLSAALREGG